MTKKSIPKVKTDPQGRRYITIGKKKLFIDKKALKTSGLTERELILKLVQTLTKRRKRKVKGVSAPLKKTEDRN